MHNLNKIENLLYYNIKIENETINVIIDFGSSVNLIDTKSNEQFKFESLLAITNKKIYPYQSKAPLPAKRFFKTLSVQNSTLSKAHVVPS